MKTIDTLVAENLVCKKCGTDQVGEIHWQSPYGEAGGNYSSTTAYPPWFCAECGPTTIQEPHDCADCENHINDANRHLDDETRCRFCTWVHREALAQDEAERHADAMAKQRKDPPR